METEKAVLDWIHTFDAGKGCNQIQELSDGTILADILHEMSPEFFEVDSLNRNTSGNWALDVSNLRTLLRLLDEYFGTVLGKKIDNSEIDLNEIARSKNIEAIINLVELVVGVAVMCESKATFIRNIFLLNPDSQAVLKELVEHVLGRATDLEDSDNAENADAAVVDVNGEEELIRTKEMLQHVQNERQRLLHDIRNLEKENSSLSAQVSSLKEKSSLSEQEREALDGSDRQRVTAVETLNLHLQKELDEIKKELDLKISENESLKTEMKTLNQRFEAAREIQAKLEMENHHQADELDIARDKIARLAKAEQTVERYQKKLEEMISLKKQNKELSDKIDQYLDQIHDLESTNKGLNNVQKMIETYKNRSIELEREKFELISSSQETEKSLQQVTQENQKLTESRVRLQEEVRSLQLQLQSFMEDENESKGASAALDLSEEMESIPQLKEKVKSLERQLRAASIQSSAPVVTVNNSEPSSGNASDIQQIKDLTQKVAATSNTVKLLEERLKERETIINKLQQEKAKLENFSKRSLETFKDKYMNILRTMQQEKKEFESVIQVQQEKLKSNQETWRREERFLSSALFEVGVKIMDRKIQAQLNESTSSLQTPFLATQREALTRVPQSNEAKAVSANATPQK